MTEVPQDTGAIGGATVTAAAYSTPLGANRDFNWLWFGKAFSEMGSGVTLLAVPLIAVRLLGASTFQVSTLQVANNLAFLLAALPVSTLIDRHRRRALMIGADTARALLLCLAAGVALAGHMDVVGLFVIIVLVGVGTVVYEGASQALIPRIVPPDQLVQANGRLSATWSAALVTGPAVGGLLFATLGVTKALLFDVATYVVSIGCMLCVRVDVQPTASSAPQSVGSGPGTGLFAGIRYIWRDRPLATLIGAGTSLNFFVQFVFAVEVVFLVRYLRIPIGLVAIPFSIAALGGIAGGMKAGWLAEKLGSARVLYLVPVGTVWMLLLVPVARPGWGVALYVLGVTGFFTGAAVLGSGSDAYIQATCPEGIVGRIASSSRWATWGIMPVGALTGGLLAAALGVRTVLLIGAIGAWASVLAVIASPLRKTRDYGPARPPMGPSVG
jgi:MFS family permease